MARKMKDSGIEWIGEIPEGWEIRKIKNNFMIYAGATPKSEKAEYWDGGIPWITPADFKTTDKYVSYGRKSLTALGYDSCGTTLVPAGSIIFSKRAPVGSVVIAKNTLCTNQGCLACIPNDAVNSTYFYYCMSIFTEQFELVSAGTTFKEISASTFASFLLPCPPLSQQNEIVNFLDKESSRIDSMLSKTHSSIEEYKKLKQAVITQAVTKGVCGEREMKDSGVAWIGKIPTTYSICKLKYLLKNPLKYGANESGIPYSDSLPRYIRITDITPDGNLKCTGKLSLSEESAKDYILEDGDILFARSGATVGKTFIYYQSYGRSAYAGYLIKASLNNKVSPKFVYYYTCSSLYEIWKNSIFIQSTIQNIGADRYENLPVPVPKTLQEQEEIADYLDAKCAEIDKLIAKKEQLVKELESYKKSLIYEVVTGKREV